MKDIIKQLHVLRSVHATEALRQRIQKTAVELPVTQRHWYVPFAFIQAAAVALALVLFVMLGSGVVLADRLSSQGQPLYAIRQTLEHLPMSFIHKHETLTPTPTMPSTPTVTPMATKAPEKGHAGENHKHFGIEETFHKAVQGIFDFKGKHQPAKQQMTGNSPEHQRHSSEE